MEQRFGILLLEKTEIIIRIYETVTNEWRLFLYQSIPLHSGSEEDIDKAMIIEALAEFFFTEEAQHITTWRAGARGYPRAVLQQISSTLDITIENLVPLREQELLCKGMFTELW